MRIFVRHETTYRYSEPARFAIQNLLLTPRNYEGQHVRRWRVEVDKDCPLREREDAFGNIQHSLSADGPFASLTTLVEGEVETFDTAGVVRGAVERFPSVLYLRETALSAPDMALRDFARRIGAVGANSLERLHALNAEIHTTMRFDAAATHSGTTAAQAYAHREGVCQDFSHVFVAVARTLGIPARYVGGYFHRSDGVSAQSAGHAWAEAYLEDLGWIGFDPTHGMCSGEAYIRVAVGLDYLGAAPVRGARTGGGAETLEVSLDIASATQHQSQS